MEENLSVKEAYQLLVNNVKNAINNNITVIIDESILFYKDKAIPVYNYLKINNYCFKTNGIDFTVKRNNKQIAKYPCIYNFLDSIVKLIPEKLKKWRSQI